MLMEIGRSWECINVWDKCFVKEVSNLIYPLKSGAKEIKHIKKVTWKSRELTSVTF